ncbi:unnamed protein product [Ilex paraguariensis]|uniref:IPO4/5-like TPR repeats domain-containing protein n=1 Tax=Ilex paraguariensis TaxID=185542 RepID=A0ABC8T757_9AQUA
MQLTLKRDLLKLVDTPARLINKELCHTVSALAASLLSKQEWPEFLSFLFELVESDKKECDLLAAMISTLKNALCSGNETMADAVNTLKLLIDLAGMKLTYWRKQIGEMVNTIWLMADDHSLKKETRRLAIEFVLTLVQFVLTLAEAEKTNPRQLKLGTEFEINMEEPWDDNKETDNYGSWQGCVDRLSILSHMIENGILTVALEVLPGYLVAPEWQKEHAGGIHCAQKEYRERPP